MTRARLAVAIWHVLASPPMRQQTREGLLTALSVQYLDQHQPGLVQQAAQVIQAERQP